MSEIDTEQDKLRRENHELRQQVTLLHDARRAYHAAFELSPNAEIITTIPEFTVVEVNRSFTVLTGIPRAEAVGKSAFELGIFAEHQTVKELLAPQFLRQGVLEKTTVKVLRHSSGTPEIRDCDVSAIMTEIAGLPHVIAILEDLTERISIDSALRESQEKFSKAFKVNPGAMVITDLDAGAVYIAANRSFEQMSGYSRTEIIGKRASDIRIFAFPDELDHVLKTLRSNGEIRSFEFTYQRKDGTHGIGLFSASLVNINGRACSVATTLDISERKKTEQFLRESEEKFAKAFKYNPGAMAMSNLSKDAEFLACNDAFELTSGFSREETIGKSAFDLGIISAFDRDRLVEKFLTVGYVRDYELTFRTKSGSVRQGLYSGVVVQIHGQQVTIGTTVDVTERQRMDAELRNERSRLLNIIDATHVGTWEWNVQTGETVFNKRWAEMIGYTLDELRPTTVNTWLKLIHPDDAPRALEQVRAHFAGTVPRYSAEMRVRHKDGSWRWILDQGTLLSRAEDGTPLMMFGTHTDIHERKNSELERERLEFQLNHARKMEAIGTLAGGIAHDFNNLLGGVLSGLSLLELEINNPQHLAEIEDMKSLVRRGADLTKHLLGFGRRGKYDIRRVDLAEISQKTCTMFGRTRKDIVMQMQFASDLDAVLMDHTQLEQVLLNLFLNAGQAMPDGGMCRVSAHNVHVAPTHALSHNVTPGRYVCLEVTDTGTGMDAETISRIFEPFFTTKTAENGSGLGLPSVYGIVHNHGGFIEVESQTNVGSRFSIYLPACDEPPEVVIPTPVVTHPGTGTVLVVDDEEALLRLYARMLKKLGYNTITASRGSDAIALLRSHPDEITLVLLDLTMPELSSTSTFEALRDISPNLKILLCSGHAVEGHAQNLLLRGANAFLQKPFDLSTLSATLQTLG